MTDAHSPPPWAAAAFASRLAPLGRTASGAVVWRIADDPSLASVSDQFRAKAGDYHARYAASDHFEALFRQTIAATGVSLPPGPAILDLGSGSGANSVAPCLRLFPNARIVATDLSGELLGILADDLARLEAQDQVVCVVMDAMSDHVARRGFDLVTGAAILHHLERPELGLAAAARALKPGGKAIFFEPFDGYNLLRLAYQRILAEAALRPGGLDPRIVTVLRAMVADIAARTDPDTTSAGFPAMDDKWLFAQERIARMARTYGFSSVEFVAHNDHPTLYRDLAQVQLRLATGLDSLALPDWALAVFDDFDAALPPIIKRRMMMEGSIVLTRAAEAPDLGSWEGNLASAPIAG
jgi:ubiquinone/menaquinone biosynthesis C-methylase UbiE